jgi:Cytochrome c554 and c-prime
VNCVRATAGIAATMAMLTLGWMAARTEEPSAPVEQPPQKVMQSVPLTDTLRLNLVGAGGCAGVACHGGPVNGLVPHSPWGTAVADLERWRSSATVWKAYDPHARAFDVLGKDLSRQIEARLPRADAKPLEARADGQCLACHANPLAAQRPRDSQPLDDRQSALLAEGVSCEACHGNARLWIDKHAGWPSGPGHSDRYALVMMTKLSDPKVRAETCVGCHVGAPAGGGAPLRDMNHDLIAAGHPRLNFDYSTYLQSLPPHWAEKDRDTSPPRLRPANGEFTHWLVGQATTAAARLRLLADRARHGPWPELAEFDCFACHHGLSTKKTNPLGPRPGSLVWNEPLLFGNLASLDVRQSISTLAMKVGMVHDDGIVQDTSMSLAKTWDETALSWIKRPSNPNDVARELASIKPRRWDEACHLYYALVAINRAGDPGASKPEDPRLAGLRHALTLPREANMVRFNSPLAIEPDQLPFAELFRALAK